MLRPWLELARISNLPTVWTNVTAAWLLAGGPWMDLRLAWLLLGGSLLYSAGMILNDVADAAHDQVHKKERPIPSGRVAQKTAWAVAGLMMATGMAIAIWPGEAHGRTTLFLVAAIVFYDLYHKPWPAAVWVMGACRVLLFLMAASAAAPLLEAPPWWPVQVCFFALSLGAYIVGLTMVARMEAKGARPTSFAALSAKFLLFSPALVAGGFWLGRANWSLLTQHGDLSVLAPAGFILIFVAMVVYATRVMRRGGPAIGQAVGILLAGIAIVDALAVMQVSLKLACGFVLMSPLLRLWQRKIAAT